MRGPRHTRARSSGPTRGQTAPRTRDSPSDPARRIGSTVSENPTAPESPAEPRTLPTPRDRGEPMFPGGPVADPAGSHHERRIRSFRPRRGRVTVGQGEALRRLWPQWGLDIDGLRRIDLGELFRTGPEETSGSVAGAPRPDLPVVLEIGFGMGEATAQMAAADPGTGILAADVHTPGQGNLLALAERNGLTNVRVANGDAIILLREMLAPAALSGLRIYFPDPWPKKRHNKRRLIQPEFIELAATRLKPGALLHCATDWEPYAEQMLEVLTASPAFGNTQPDGGYSPRPDFRPLTKFEGQGLDKGHLVHDLIFRRNDT
ncbi:tRNA (guanosine(46)-N7)-methyltransferase TrmB [Streptomyces cucumeris]|uniref:tRNA (guanosine(46)-N7)-methyltransferase TrmB n=1 Tax=Streptomyces cucumeris TaxID=2962890 RepID=UPI003D72AA43